MEKLNVTWNLVASGILHNHIELLALYGFSMETYMIYCGGQG